MLADRITTPLAGNGTYVWQSLYQQIKTVVRANTYDAESGILEAKVNFVRYNLYRRARRW